MLRTLLRDAAVYGASTVLTRAVALLVVPIYTRLLDPLEYGAIDILSIFSNLVTLTVALEIGQAVARFMPDARSDAARASIVSTAAFFAVAAYTAFVAVALLFVDPLRQLLVGELVSTTAVALAVLSAWAIGLFQLLQTVLRFGMRPVAFMVASLVFSLGGLALSVAFVVGFDAGVAGIFAGQVIGGLVGSAVAIWSVRSLFVPRFDQQLLRRLLAFSMPFLPASLGVFVTLYVDRIALNELASLSAVGIFGVGYRLASVINLLLIGFQMALTPLIYQRYQEPSTPVELARIFRVFVGIALLATAAVSVFAPEILLILTTPDYFPAYAVVPLLAPAILLSNMYVFTPGLSIAKQTRMIAIIAISGGVLNAILNVLLIPVLGIQGAAVATLATATAVFAAYAVSSQRAYPVPHRWAPVLQAALGYAIAMGATAALEPMSPISVVAKILVLGVLAVVVLTVGLIRPAELTWAVGRLSQRARRQA